MSAKVVYFVALILAISSSALALKCYKCDSSDNALCSYGLSSFTYNSVDCNEDSALGSTLGSLIPKQCVKLVAQDKDGKEYIARGCMPHSGGACNAVAKVMSFFTSIEGNIKDMQCYPCDTDKCNSARSLTGYTLMGIILAAAVFMF